MRHAFSSTLALLLLTSLFVTPAAAQKKASEDTAAVQAPVDTSSQIAAAREAAQAWLAHTDAQDYQKSWETGAPMLKEQVTAEKWTQALQQVHTQTGALQERSFARAQYTTSLPSLPKGQYVVLFYGSQFEKAAAQELVVMAREDGEWKTAGYRVLPSQGQQSPQGN